MNVWGSESERFVLPFGEIQETVSRSTCSSRRYPRKERVSRSPEILLGHQYVTEEANIQSSFKQWEDEYTVPCQTPLRGGGNCKGRQYWDRREFIHDRPPILIASISFLSNQRGLTGRALPDQIEALGKWYQLYGFTKTMSDETHFIGYFRSSDSSWLRYKGLDYPEVEPVSSSEIDSSTNMEHIVLKLLIFQTKFNHLRGFGIMG